ncbi:unnamed protein product [Arctia plantaginis]|uniref:Uncharacterized protein n=1 Tax=Arctia plantaginis TaxID=874455 RepID=A0A8S0ZBW5_ARCPL|nr:unnamed protein product [Arctia plantaginis]
MRKHNEYLYKNDRFQIEIYKIQVCEIIASRSEEPAPCPTSSTSDERPLANIISHDSRTPSPSILNLPATPPQIIYETEGVHKSAENPEKNLPDLAISEVMLNTIAMPATTGSIVNSKVFTSDIIPVASTSRDTSVTVTVIPFSPETLRALPKAPPRKGNQTNTRKVKSAILTNTPVKNELAAIEAARTAKKKVKKPNFEETKQEKDQNQALKLKTSMLSRNKEKTKIVKKKKNSFAIGAITRLMKLALVWKFLTFATTTYCNLNI